MRTIMLTAVFGLLLTGFVLLFREFRLLEKLGKLLLKTQSEMDEAARKRGLEERQKLVQMRREHTLWTILERELNYTGLKLRFPMLTAEILIMGNLLAAAATVLLLAAAGFSAVIWGLLVLFGCEAAVIRWLRAANFRMVNEHMMKLLDFLGNYSITAGEVTGILQQVSRYMEEPLKSVLESCFYEARLTGDTGLALLSMAEKIEHPKFKELARNMEVSLRYCADLTALVAGSRRSLREYLRMSGERKGMLREAFVNMALLFGMSLITLIIVCYLVQIPLIRLLTGTLPGKIGLMILTVIVLLFFRQVNQRS